MPFDLTIPRSNGSSLGLTLNVGEVLFVLGPNGSGKSAVMHRFYKAHDSVARRISAHRQTWFESNASTLSADQKRNTERNMQGTDTNPEARWRDHYPSHRPSIAISDLIDAENSRARSVASAVDADNIDLAKTLSAKDAPIKIINELLRLSNIPIVISVRETDQVIAIKSGSVPYSIANCRTGNAIRF
jgi:hypothetical protein